MVYYLTCFEREGDEYIGETLLPGVGEDEVRRVFGLKPDEPPGDCLEVKENHLEWLREKAEGVQVELDFFDYFVEACQS